MLVLARIAGAQIVAPGDVYWKVHVDQKFQYYAFAQDAIVWENADHEGTALSVAASHDSLVPGGDVRTSVTVAADAGTFTADFASHIGVQARTGIYHLMTNRLVVSAYVKGPAGTRYWIARSDSAGLLASRLGGAPGSLQPVNGISTATYTDSTLQIDSTGTLSMPVAEARMDSGSTTTTITVGADTYSLARAYTLQAPVWTRQNVCILGCMTDPATFLAESGGRTTLQVFPYSTPVAAPPAAPARLVALSASPNPAVRGTTIGFRAPAGAHARVSVFDVAGRRVARLYDGVATGSLQQVEWRPSRGAPGLYLARIEGDFVGDIARIALLD